MRYELCWWSVRQGIGQAVWFVLCSVFYSSTQQSREDSSFELQRKEWDNWHQWAISHSWLWHSSSSMKISAMPKEDPEGWLDMVVRTQTHSDAYHKSDKYPDKMLHCLKRKWDFCDLRSRSLWWYNINTIIEFLDIIHQSVFFLFKMLGSEAAFCRHPQASACSSEHCVHTLPLQIMQNCSSSANPAIIIRPVFEG